MEALTYGATTLRRYGLAKLAILALLCFSGVAKATNYTFPGNMPSGCSGSAGNYTCGVVILFDWDTVTINSPKPATITATYFDSHGAQINAAGSASDLSIIVSGGGLFSNSNGAIVNANVTAGYISSSGTVTFGGSLTANTYYVSLGGPVTVGGSISAKTYVFIGLGFSRSTINGSISAQTNQVDIYNSDVSGSLNAGSYVNITSNTAVAGNATAATDVFVYSGSSVAQCVRSTASSIYHIWNNSGSSMGGGCCGSVGTCSNSCVVYSPKPTACQTLDHLELTATSSSAAAGANVVYTIKACANAACSSLYTWGVTGTLSISGVTPTYVTGTSFSIPFGSSTTTETVQMTAGTATASLTGLNPSPSNSSTFFCGMGVTAASGNSCALTVAAPLHHIELTASSNSAVTCTPLTYTVKACADLACTPYTGGLTGNLTVSGVTVNYPSGAGFSIPNGSSTTNVSAHAVTVGTATASLSALSVAPSNTPQVFCGMGAAAASGGSCAISMVNSAFLFDVPDHLSNSAQTVTVSAVKSSNNATVCTPAFTTTKNVTFKCSYSNPISGTLPVKVGTSYLNASNNSAVACDGTGQPVSLSFNASGVATTTVQYADVGQMSLTARYDGSGSDAGLVMQGIDTFWSAPWSIIPSAWTAGPIKAGQTFTATLTAYNTTGQVVRNFGQEASPQALNFIFYRGKPTGASAVDGVFTQQVSSFSNGVGTVSMTWSEVGYMDFLVEMQNRSYQGTIWNASGATGGGGNVGPFVPDHFTTDTTNACSGVFTYSGQPFVVNVTAMNANNVKVQNYDGTVNTSPNYARDVTLSVGSNGGSGSMPSIAVPASNFNQGVATVSNAVFTFTNKITAPTTISVRARENVDATMTSSGFTEGTLALRSGRLRFSNAFGSEKASLTLPVQTQYWSGKSWIKSAGDSCTSVLASAVALSGYTNGRGGTGTWTSTASPITVSNGDGILTLYKPSPTATGSANVAINLGNTIADNSCLGTHPATTGAGLSWLRSMGGNCAATYDRDPSARATFGIYSSETKKTIYFRAVD